MNTPYTITALLACMLVAYPSGAQETVSPATAAPEITSAAPSPTPPASTAPNSKVRIVRLSEVKGEVQMDRLTGKGFEPAVANLPIIEGARLKTGTGVAEVEFEDNSTVRLAPDSVIEFPQLELMPGGVRTSTLAVKQGIVYVSLVKDKSNQFNVKFGDQTASLPPESHIRLDVTPTNASMAVIHGEVAVQDPAGTSTVTKNKTATFAAGQSQPTIAKNLTDQPFDKWDTQSTQYHKSFANATSYGGAPYAYGLTDMNYYGGFVNGCGGSLWRPYFASAAWDPYGSGAWAYYSGAGYSWVSPYPWGWTPYHTGSWSFCQGVGWGWMPGGGWYGLHNTAYLNAANRYPVTGTGVRPHPPVGGPVAGPVSARSTFVPVNMKSVPASSLTGQDKFVFKNDSAGMGVPRGGLGKLGGYSNHVAQHGTASTTVYSSVPSSSGAGPAASSGFSAMNRGQSNSHMQGAVSSGGMHSSMQSAPSGGGMHSGGGGGGASGGGGGGHR
jgi:hypothetical protein